MVEFRNPEGLIGSASTLLGNLIDSSQEAPYIKRNPPLGLVGRKGGALCVANSAGIIISTTLHGEIPEEKIPRCRYLAYEKTVRLLANLSDEAFMLLLANHTSDIDESESDRIAEISSNPHWAHIRKAYGY
jgi:hypothetical protein